MCQNDESFLSMLAQENLKPKKLDCLRVVCVWLIDNVYSRAEEFTLSSKPSYVYEFSV